MRTSSCCRFETHTHTHTHTHTLACSTSTPSSNWPSLCSHLRQLCSVSSRLGGAEVDTTLNTECLIIHRHIFLLFNWRSWACEFLEGGESPGGRASEGRLLDQTSSCMNPAVGTMTEETLKPPEDTRFFCLYSFFFLFSSKKTAPALWAACFPVVV